MSVKFTEEQLGFVAMVRDFMKREVEPYKAQWDEEGYFPVDTYKKAFQLGLNMLEVPEEYGGAGLDHQTMALIYEEVGYWEPGFGLSMLTSCVQPLKATIHFGTPEQIQMVSDVIGNGGFGCYALTEAESGSDASALSTTYKEDGDYYVITGTKTFATLAEYADVFMVFATKDKKLGSKGVSAFIVPGHQEGIMVGKHENKMGFRLSNTAEVSFDNVRVPKENLVGGEGNGMRVALGTLNLGRLEIASVATGIMRRALEESVKYAKERQVFGKPIIKHQLVFELLANMEMSVEASKALIQEGMEAYDAGEKRSRVLASCAKLFACDAVVQVTQDAVQVFGGYGYSKEYPVEKLYRDAKVFQIFEGSQEIQKLIIGRELENMF